MSVTVTAPGLIHGMSDADYHLDPVPGGSLSSTFARLLTEHVPAKADAIRRNRRPTGAMNLGKAAHQHALGAGPELIVWQHDGRTKAGKEERAHWKPLIDAEAAIGVTEAERNQVADMVAALLRHAEVREILAACDSEVSAFWQAGDVWCRARYDLLGAEAWDYKTTQDVSDVGFSRALGKFGYHQQSDHYLRGLRALDHPAAGKPLRFICQETAPPYLVRIHEPDAEAMAAAEVLNDKAIDTYAAAKAAGIWPGYDSLYADPAPLPGWYLSLHDDDLEMVI